MTKEELKLEALKYLENFQDCAKCKHRRGDCADELDEDCLINNCYSATPKEQDIYLAAAEPREKRIAELEAQIEKMKCCGNCQKLRCRFDSKTNINILYCSDSDMKQIEVGFQMCCCKWEIKEND